MGSCWEINKVYICKTYFYAIISLLRFFFQLYVGSMGLGWAVRIKCLAQWLNRGSLAVLRLESLALWSVTCSLNPLSPIFMQIGFMNSLVRIIWKVGWWLQFINVNMKEPSFPPAWTWIIPEFLVSTVYCSSIGKFKKKNSMRTDLFRLFQVSFSSWDVLYCCIFLFEFVLYSHFLKNTYSKKKSVHRLPL